jgi:hypothetical protein
VLPVMFGRLLVSLSVSGHCAAEDSASSIYPSTLSTRLSPHPSRVSCNPRNSRQPKKKKLELDSTVLLV